MHQQPTYTITFDRMAGVGPLTVTADQMDDQIHRAFLDAGVVHADDEFAAVIDVPAGTIVVRADGGVIEHGTITTAAALPARSAYWRTLADGLQVAGWVHDATTPMADGRTEELLLHPSGRQITAMTAADGTTDLTMTGLTLEQVADAVTAAGLTGQSAAPTEVDALVDGITTLLDGPGGSTVGAEHAHVGGVIGGRGENEAECACGLVFAGFDSQTEALAELDRHIADPVEQPQDWIFTFGSGQQYDGRFVVIHGTRQSARDLMFEVFGTAWAFQYTDREAAQVDRFSMVELPESQWPTTSTGGTR